MHIYTSLSFRQGTSYPDAKGRVDFRHDDALRLEDQFGLVVRQQLLPRRQPHPPELHPVELHDRRIGQLDPAPVPKLLLQRSAPRHDAEHHGHQILQRQRGHGRADDGEERHEKVDAAVARHHPPRLLGLGAEDGTHAEVDVVLGRHGGHAVVDEFPWGGILLVVRAVVRRVLGGGGAEEGRDLQRRFFVREPRHGGFAELRRGRIGFLQDDDLVQKEVDVPEGVRNGDVRGGDVVFHSRPHAFHLFGEVKEGLVQRALALVLGVIGPDLAAIF
mmetsp:Transcript_20666/g.46869  ORF Transcript_20666/g.46869 Transcript_20666/m.46869 type:complete len:274 (+) Transcript_20666:325-1146(+)